MLTIAIVVVLLLVVLNGLFAMTELAVVSSRKSKLQSRAERGDRGARAALKLSEEPTQFLSAVQVGITLIGILAGAYGQATIAGELDRILETNFPAFAPYSGDEIQPGAGAQSDDEIGDYIRRAGTTIYHPVGTCKMGEDPLAVVDSRLRVRGLSGLRVIDASVMPAVTTGNTNGPTIMIGEKGAAMIREDAKAAA